MSFLFRVFVQGGVDFVQREMEQIREQRQRENEARAESKKARLVQYSVICGANMRQEAKGKELVRKRVVQTRNDDDD